MPGNYNVDLFLGSRRQLDIIYEAAQFDVHPADVFGNGKLPPPTTGSLFWPIYWGIKPEVCVG